MTLEQGQSVVEQIGVTVVEGQEHAGLAGEEASRVEEIKARREPFEKLRQALTLEARLSLSR